MKRAYFQLHFAVLLWGFTGIFGKLISLNEDLLVWYRMLLSALGLYIFLYLKKQFHTLPAKAALKSSAVGVLVCLHWITFYAAIKASNVSVALSCFSSIALFTALLDPLMNKQKPNASEIILSIAVLLGIFIIFNDHQLYIKGILLALFSAFLAAIFTVYNKQLAMKHEPAIVSVYELASGFLFLTALLPFYRYYTDTSWQNPTGSDIFYLLLLSFVCTSFAFTLGNYALQKLDAFTCNLTVNLEPVYSIILAIIIFGEDKFLHAGFYAGTVLILASVVVHTLYKYKRQTA